MANSPSNADVHHHHLLPTESESQLSSLVYDMSRQVETALENMLKIINEIDQNSTGITEDVENCKVSALERKRNLEERKEMLQNAACTVIEMLNKRI